MYNPDMDTWDWIIAGAFVALLGFVFYLLLPPYGVLIGAGLGAFLMFQSKKRRDNLRRKQ